MSRRQARCVAAGTVTGPSLFQVTSRRFTRRLPGFAIAATAGGQSLRRPSRRRGTWEPGREAPVPERVAGGLLLALAVRATLVEVARVAESVVLRVPRPAARVLRRRPKGLALRLDPRRRRPDQGWRSRPVCADQGRGGRPVRESTAPVAAAVRRRGRGGRGGR